MRTSLLLPVACIAAIGCFPDWDRLDPSSGANPGGAGGSSSSAGGSGGTGTGSTDGGGGTGGAGGAGGLGGAGGSGGMEPLGPWSTPQIVAVLSHPADDDDPSMTADGLELYFNSDRSGADDIWLSIRSSRQDSWGTPVPVDDLNSTANETNQTVSPDGLTMWFGSNRTGTSLIYVSTRPDRDSSWSVPQVDNDLESQDISDVNVTADALLLVGNASTTEDSDLVMLVRASPSQTWGAAVPVAELNSPSNDDEAWLHPDGTHVCFGSNRPGGLGSKDLYCAARRTTAEPFGMVEHQVELASTAGDTDPSLTPDLRYILFARDVVGGEREIFEAFR